MSVESHDADVVVIGAGLAGLRCARVLQEAGLSTIVLERSDEVGGREKTEKVDGFLVDVGFHVVNPAYPALRRAVSLPDLDLRPFGAGLRVRRDRGSVTLTHPVREPRGIPGTLRSGYVTPRVTAALLRWLGPALASPEKIKTDHDVTLREGMRRAGVTGPIADDVIVPFLAGVLLESGGETSDAFARLLIRMFALGVPGLPATGVQRLPELLAQPLPDVRTGTAVDKVTASDAGVLVEGAGKTVRARACVVAVGAEDYPALTGDAAPATKSLVTWWFATSERPTASRMLTVDGRHPRGPAINALVVSNAVPTYAPAGRHLVQATCIAEDGATSAPEPDVRRHVGEMLECSTTSWEVLRRHEVPHALPAQPAPLSLARPAKVGERAWACGDHRDTASIQGALVSGERVAAEVISEFRG